MYLPLTMHVNQGQLEWNVIIFVYKSIQYFRQKLKHIFSQQLNTCSHIYLRMNEIGKYL